VTTGGASAVTSTSATVMGTVNPKGQATTYDFQFGTTTAYGSQTAPTSAGSGTTDINVSAALSSLPPNTTIHYRLTATNASGTTLGRDRSFKTSKQPSARITISASPNPVTFGHGTTISGKVTAPKTANSTVTLQESASSTGPFVTVRTTTTNSAGHYSFSPVAPQANTFFRTLSGGVASGTLRVKLRFRITLFVSNTHPASGSLVRFHGRVAPRHNGLRARIQRLTSGGFWHTIARAQLTSASGNASAYSVRVRVHRGGLYRAVVGPDAHHARGFGRDIRIRVH
jgi:hypothetical protein